jgi:AraC-like DNA-binding protein
MDLAETNWKPLQPAVIRRLPARVSVRVVDIPPFHYFPAHKHQWNQLVYCISGSWRLAVQNHWFVIGPEQAVWIPVGTVHEVASTYGATSHTLYIDQAIGIGMPTGYAVVSVTPLLRQLILEAAAIGQRDDEPAYKRRVLRLILDQLPRLPRVAMSLPWPRSKMLRRLCEAVYLSPADDIDLSEWGSKLGASRRTLSRRFQDELGLTFRDWKARLRLVKSMELLGAGRSVTATAFELGYNSASAFSYMFTKAMGYTPKEHLATRRDRAAS